MHKILTRVLRVLNIVEPRLTATSVIRSPRYYGHFFSARKKRSNGQRPHLKSQTVEFLIISPQCEYLFEIQKIKMLISTLSLFLYCF